MFQLPLFNEITVFLLFFNIFLMKLFNFRITLDGVCIGSVSIFPVFEDSKSVITCGPAVLDETNNVAVVAHPMTGGLRLSQVEIVLHVGSCISCHLK